MCTSGAMSVHCVFLERYQSILISFNEGVVWESPVIWDPDILLREETKHRDFSSAESIQDIILQTVKLDRARWAAKSIRLM